MVGKEKNVACDHYRSRSSLRVEVGQYRYTGTGGPERVEVNRMPIPLLMSPRRRGPCIIGLHNLGSGLCIKSLQEVRVIYTRIPVGSES